MKREAKAHIKHILSAINSARQEYYGIKEAADRPNDTPVQKPASGPPPHNG